MEMKFDDFNAVIKEIVVAHKFKYEPGTFAGYQSGRKVYGLIYILTGSLDYIFADGKRLTVKANDAFLLKPKDAYKVICSDTCLHYTVNFKLHTQSIEGEIAKRILLGEGTSLISQDKTANYLADTFDELCDIWAKKTAGYKMRSNSALYKLLYNFISSQATLYQSKNLIKLSPAKEYIEANWNKDISLSTLASLCNMSVTHFRHVFGETLGTTPLSYRDSLRLLYAKDYLQRENYTVNEVAYKCGFEDANYFCRFFKKHTGSSPGKYRIG